MMILVLADPILPECNPNKYLGNLYNKHLINGYINNSKSCGLAATRDWKVVSSNPAEPNARLMLFQSHASLIDNTRFT